ncbi:hypothetical protein OC845_006661, partial [Tilletia horrida]
MSSPPANFTQSNSESDSSSLPALPPLRENKYVKSYSRSTSSEVFAAAPKPSWKHEDHSVDTDHKSVTESDEDEDLKRFWEEDVNSA